MTVHKSLLAQNAKQALAAGLFLHRIHRGKSKGRCAQPAPNELFCIVLPNLSLFQRCWFARAAKLAKIICKSGSDASAALAAPIRRELESLQTTNNVVKYFYIDDRKRRQQPAAAGWQKKLAEIWDRQWHDQRWIPPLLSAARGGSNRPAIRLIERLMPLVFQTFAPARTRISRGREEENGRLSHFRPAN